MKRIIEFNTKAFSKRLSGLEAIDIAVLTSSLSEIDNENLVKVALTSETEGRPMCWDIAFVNIFGEEFRVRHWLHSIDSVHHTPMNMHAELRKMKGGLLTAREGPECSKRIMTIFNGSAISTIAFIAIARLPNGRKHHTLWHHPRLNKKEALVILERFLSNHLEENA